MAWDVDRQTFVAQNPGKPSTSRMPLTGPPNTYGYDEFGRRLRYATSRPKLREDEIEKIFKTGASWDPVNKVHYRMVPDTSGARVRVDWLPVGQRRGKWDIGHISGEEYRSLERRYLDPKGDLDYEGFMAEFHKLEQYEIQHPLRNQSHMDEAP